MGDKIYKQKGYTHKLCCSEETFRKIMNECVKDFLEHHPEMKGMNITQNFILLKIAEYYLEH
jgi:hypothetical protein